MQCEYNHDEVYKCGIRRQDHSLVREIVETHVKLNASYFKLQRFKENVVHMLYRKIVKLQIIQQFYQDFYYQDFQTIEETLNVFYDKYGYDEVVYNTLYFMYSKEMAEIYKQKLETKFELDDDGVMFI
ncbi:Hypothetical_protein [Hexamita inflata]|uniref:Hypothetical_protein n=1 Tax=Hexamita inflata TaxID=28002 RepID=A0AA86QCK0_9EUKA|nr:Hypothetical protein HINF_LOCUS40073 [Hexamita inflata]